MVRLLIRTLIFLGSSALGLLAAQLILDGFKISVSGFVLTVVVFSVIQSVLAPFIAKMARRYASFLLGGIGLLAAFVGLVAASWLTDGLTITGLSTWILASLVVWLVTAIATVALPAIFLKKKVEGRRSGSAVS